MNAAPILVKLGGSFALSSRLRDWVAAIAAAREPVVLVPGGGPFADAVRAAQAGIGFSDRAAHRMAILAMAQFSEVLADLDDRLAPAADLESIILAHRQGRPVVWNPLPLALDPEIPHSWSVTSDSLAAWLASRLNARHLILVKHWEDGTGQALTARRLAEQQIVDDHFPEMARAFSGAIWLAGPDGLPGLRQALEGRPPDEAGLTRLWS